MKHIILTCNHCSGPLEATASAHVVICPHCTSQLRIQHGDGVLFTSVIQAVRTSSNRLDQSIERLDDAQEAIDNQLHELRLENAILELDRRWDKTEDGLQVFSWRGPCRIPTITGAIQVLLMAVVMIVVSVIASPLRWVPAAVAVVGFLEFTRRWIGYVEHRQQKQTYEQQRGRLIRQLEAVREGNFDVEIVE